MITYVVMSALSFLLGSTAGRITLAVVILLYVDQRYFGLLTQLWAPIRRAQRVAGLRHAVDVNPSDVRSMVELAELSLNGGKPAAAAEYLDRAFARGENSARALFLQGAAWVETGRPEAGQKRLAEALALTPTVAYGQPYLYLLKAAFATEGANSPQVDTLIDHLDEFDGVEVLTRAGQICWNAGRKELAVRLLEEAIKNYGYVPRKMRWRERRWLVRARLALLAAR